MKCEKNYEWIEIIKKKFNFYCQTPLLRKFKDRRNKPLLKNDGDSNQMRKKL